MSNVYLIEPSRRPMDLSSAKSFGELVYLFGPDERRASVFQVDQFSDQVIDALQEKNFNYEEDYFCVMGGLLQVTLFGIALGAFAEQNQIPYITLLMYNSPHNAYEERRLNFNE